jgi:hypothetical protein
MSTVDKDHARVSVCAQDAASGVRRGDLVAWLLEKLEHEQLAEAPEHSDVENAYRRGWNRRARALAGDVRLYCGLAELAASDVDGGGE